MKKQNPFFRVKGFINQLVHLAGIEPVRVSPLDPKSSASASSAIGAVKQKEGTCPSVYYLVVPSIGIEPTT